MIRYIILFVLVIMMVKTNAQTTTFKGITLTETSDKLLVRLQRGASDNDLALLMTKIATDPDFTTTNDGTGGYVVLTKNSTSTISKSAAISNYESESYVASATFLFDDVDGYLGVSNEIILALKSGVTVTQMVTAASAYGMLAYEAVDASLGIYVLMFPKSSDIFQVSKDLDDPMLFESVDPNIFMATNLDGYGDRSTSGPTPSSCETLWWLTKDQYNNNRYQWGIFDDGGNNGHNGSGNFSFTTTYTGYQPFLDVNVCRAWRYQNGSALMHPKIEYVTGNNIVVAVLDDGVDTRHPDLNILRDPTSGWVIGYDAIKRAPFPVPAMATIHSSNWPDDEGCPDYYSHHGTECAGIIGAKRNNAFLGYTGTPDYYGMAGVAHDSKLMPVRIFWTSVYDGLKYSDIYFQVRGIKNAVALGADVLSNSWSYDGVGVPYAATLQLELDNALKNGRGGKGCAVVFSTGNLNTSNINWPSSHPDVISVGAMNMCAERKQAGSTGLNPGVSPGTVSCDGVNSWGSNYGYGASWAAYNPGIKSGGKLSVTAPGVQILTTGILNMTSPYSSPFNKTDFIPNYGGTSAAAPHVAGVAALMLSINPCLRSDEVKNIIELSADKVGSYIYNNPGFMDPNGRWNDEMGYGKVNAGNAVTLSYDIYKQNYGEAGNKTFMSTHSIYSGSNVTNIIDPGKYIVHSAAKVNFYSPETIILDPGFEAEYGSAFDAKITSYTCNVSHQHFKTTDEESEGRVVRTFKEKISDNVRVYPNPVKEKLNIEFTISKDALTQISIVNIVGQNVMSAKQEKLKEGKYIRSFPTNELVPGVYMILFKSGDNISQFKFVKQ
ncbi:MAG: S8/S53 family peptidase [Flavipsychrobacter sp.]